MLKQFLQYKLSQKLSPQQIQLMKLIQLPTQAFEQRLKQEIEENPALEKGKEESDEFDDSNQESDIDSDSEIIDAQDINIDEYLSDDEIPSYKTQANNYSPDDEEKNIPYAGGISFNQMLLNQLRTYSFTEHEEGIAEFLIGSIDDSGYIRRDIEDLIDDLAFTQNTYTNREEVLKLLNIVQDLDPPGVGALNLQDCLLIQLKRKQKSISRILAVDILEKSFESFAKKHYKKIFKKFNCTEEQLKEVIIEIEKLNPKPGGSIVGNNKISQQIVPDFTITISEGELALNLNGRNCSRITCF